MFLRFEQTDKEYLKMKKKERHIICPFWSPTTKICKVQATGLFIPLDDHIQMYCKCPEHVLCQQYMLSQDTGKETEKAGPEVKAENRRQYPRIKSNHQLTLVRLSSSGHVVNHDSSRASTLDLSSGGMRLTTREIFMNDSMIQFHFKSSFPSSLKIGLAKVKWCVPADNELEYHVGLAFQNDQVIQAMGDYLGSRA
jgi:hypothetical protein